MKKLVSSMVLVVFLSIANGYCLTVDELRTEIRYLIRDKEHDDTTKQRWTDAQLLSRINMGQLDIVSKTRCLEQFVLINTYDNQREYLLPSDILVIKRVSYSVATTSTSVVSSTTSFKKIDRYTLFGLDESAPIWDNTFGQPTKYYVRASSIGVVPTPSTSYTGSNRLRIDYIVNPSTLSANTDVPFNNATYLYQYNPIITYYVAMLCKADEGLFSDATYFERKYYNALQMMVSELNSKPDWFPNFEFRNK